jgi:hypothetical protein
VLVLDDFLAGKIGMCHGPKVSSVNSRGTIVTIPSKADWCTDAIRALTPERAERLEAAGSPDDLLAAMLRALQENIHLGDVRFGADRMAGKPDRRMVVQFKISPELYDWFFNSRTGYRAQFWIGVNEGLAFNENITAKLTSLLLPQLPERVCAQTITIRICGDSREEQNDGPTTLDRDWIARSLVPAESKVWICERLICSIRNPNDIGLSLLSRSECCLPKLKIPRWQCALHPKTQQRGEGLRAPYPEREEAWLDLKGAVVGTDGSVRPSKPPSERARDIHERGWT